MHSSIRIFKPPKLIAPLKVVKTHKRFWGWGDCVLKRGKKGIFGINLCKLLLKFPPWLSNFPVIVVETPLCFCLMQQEVSYDKNTLYDLKKPQLVFWGSRSVHFWYHVYRV